MHSSISGLNYIMPLIYAGLKQTALKQVISLGKPLPLWEKIYWGGAMSLRDYIGCCKISLGSLQLK